MSKHSPPATSRALAVTCLADWSGSGRPIRELLDPLLSDPRLKNADRQLTVMLVMGVLRRLQYLDIILARFSKTPLRKMKPLTLAALRVGIYQVCFLDRIPDSAAVNETVKVLKKKRQPGWLIRFVNGTLRAVVRQKDTLPPPESAGPDNTPVPEHPDWMYRRWQERFGPQRAAEICRINTSEPNLCLQVNTTRISTSELAALFEQAGLEAVPGRYAPDSLVLPGFRGPVTALPGFAEGLFQVQDQAAALAVTLCAPLVANGRYLDGCAGLGGKTSALARRLPAGASLTAVEPEQRRFGLLKENLARLQPDPSVAAVHATLAEFTATAPPPFDGILIDAPCSGTGVIRRHPDIRWNRTPEDPARFQEIQLDLLRTAASLLRPGGFLVYATCSLEDEENHQVIDRFLAEQKAFTLADCRPLLPGETAGLVDDSGCFAPLPAEDIEGFFAARLTRKPDNRS
jgi:16S rRNA (cytosine967-C5)-methyltransferase